MPEAGWHRWVAALRQGARRRAASLLACVDTALPTHSCCSTGLKVSRTCARGRRCASPVATKATPTAGSEQRLCLVPMPMLRMHVPGACGRESGQSGGHAVSCSLLRHTRPHLGALAVEQTWYIGLVVPQRHLCTQPGEGRGHCAPGRRDRCKLPAVAANNSLLPLACRPPCPPCSQA